MAIFDKMIALWILVVFSFFTSCSAGKSEKQAKWDKYLKHIEDAVTDYEECSSENSGCYRSVLDADFKPWRDRGGIKQEDFERGKKDRRNGVVHYQIIGHKLYRQENSMFQPRSVGIEHFLLKLLPLLPDMELLINTQDYPMVNKWIDPTPILSFSRTPNEVDIFYPAWTFWSGGPFLKTYPEGLGRWDEQRKVIGKKSEEFPWKKKKSKAFFRGSRTSSERDPLVKYARQNPSYADAAYTKNQAWKSDADTLGKPPAGEISLADHCKYKYLFNFRGVAASFRFKHLFMCRSLVVHVGEDWKEFFYPAMKPWVHYIPMDVEMKDLPVMIEFVRKYDKVARAIADRGYKFVDKHLRLKDIELYWKNLLLTYHSLMQWKPKRDMSLKQIK
ncbi:O-glucosyltransferase rumi homolog [Sycon ciliatum]|uniref:O-glucosyltransferase rumi homolog n=1 Tax=Sycon ciliatum TaxID=27933 RepID=UPI0031F67D64